MAKTSKQKPRTPEAAYQKVFKAVSKILTPNEEYIYRGEDEQFDRPGASSLYREYKKILKGDPENPYEPPEEIVTSLSKWNRERLIEDVHDYYPDTTDNERLAAVQHLGGATNFVDFSEDLNVALFFACYKNPDKNGRIIVMPSSKNERESTSMKKGPTSLETLNDNKVFIPRRAGNDPGYQRARAQRGLVVYCPEGYIKEDKYKKVEIVSQDKLLMLEYLRKYHGIDYQTIFYDIHGYIELTKYRHTLLREYYIAVDRMKYEDAEKKISELINMSGIYWEYNERGVLYADMGDYPKAMENFDRAIKLNPNYSRGYYNRGKIYGLQGDHARAILEYSEAIKLNPKYSYAYNNRGRSYSLQGDYARAILEYSEAIKINPKYSRGYYNRGKVYSSQGDNTHAISDYSKAIRLNPKFSEAYINRGVAYFVQGKYDLATSDYAQALKLNPEDSIACYNLGTIHIERNNPKRDIVQAKKYYLRAVKLNPKLDTPKYRKPFEKYL